MVFSSFRGKFGVARRGTAAADLRFGWGEQVRSVRAFAARIGVPIFFSTSLLLAQQGQTPRATLTAERATAQSAETSGHPVASQRNPRYRINRDDVLSISFALTPEFNQPKVMVQPDGYITLQGAGTLLVQNLTVPEAVEAVKKAYSKTLHDPIVDIDLIDFQKAYFVVLGQVGKPGQYDLRYDMTVTEAVAVAGGFSATAKTRVFLYRRMATGWQEAKELKLNDILHGKNVTEDAEMHPGDMIFVPEKTITKIRKYIPYGVGTSVSTSPSSYY
jgi:polysaccharide export outer membrane protein